MRHITIDRDGESDGFRLYFKDKDFVSWANVWVMFQALFAINAVYWSTEQGIELMGLVVAFVATWIIYQTNKL